jgi:hypothetical protein
MQFSAEGGSHVLTVGNQSRLAIRDLVPTGVENGPPARLTGEFHPLTAAGLSDGEVTLSKAETGSDLEAFGVHWRPKAGLWAHFSWAG